MTNVLRLFDLFLLRVRSSDIIGPATELLDLGLLEPPSGNLVLEESIKLGPWKLKLPSV